MGLESWFGGRRGDFLLRDGVRKGLLQMQLLDPGLGGSCTPSHKWFKHVANDTFPIRFDDGVGWGSVAGNEGCGGAKTDEGPAWGVCSSLQQIEQYGIRAIPHFSWNPSPLLDMRSIVFETNPSENAWIEGLQGCGR
jgi:hypothetical protein